MKKIRALEPQLLVLEALTYNQWVITMGQMLQATSMDLYIHCVNVASIAAHMALFGNRQMLNEQGISPISLVLGAFLHDIGYIGKGCCSACGKNPQSMSYMEQLAFDEHISAGLEQVKHHTDDPVVLDIVSMHHEYLNGTGYPNGCWAEDIPPHVRLVSIANSLCAYLENTQHTSSDSTPMLMTELLDYLHNESISGKYDITLLNAFFDGIMSYYDSLIPLHNGLRDYCSEKG